MRVVLTFFFSRLINSPAGPLALLLLVAACCSKPARGQAFSYSHSPAIEVIEDIERVTPYRFLYRDALISGVRVSLVANRDALLSELHRALSAQGLRLQIEPDRKMVFVLPMSATPKTSFAIRGTVSDAKSLERLPRAALFWKDARGDRGEVTDDGGRFLIEFAYDRNPILLVTSYLGYVSDSLVFDPATSSHDLSITLRPRVMIGSEVVVSSPLLSSNLDSTWFYLLTASLATPVGEQSVTRALQSLPAVGLTAAVSSGLNIRGSRTDGFQILLDGVPVYSQSHFFGMFDAFNPDALQAVDFYYGVAPARFQAPPGGTLSFLTRPGSKRRFGARAGLTSTAASATAEGPLGSGLGSWIVSARRSYLDSVDWFNNDGLLAMGLGVGRETSATRRVPLDDRTLVSGQPHASFYDIHSKFEHESGDGTVFQISAYAGGDNTTQDGTRVVALAPQRQDPLIRSIVTTSNDWGNITFSAHYSGAVHDWGYSHTYAGVTLYYRSFRKDDFFYLAPQQGSLDPDLLFAPFLNDNSLAEARLAHESYISLSPTLSASTGFSVQRLINLYDELSALRREFESDRRAWQLDSFAEVTGRSGAIKATLGVRPHYYSAGRYLRVSPRFALVAFESQPLSASAGYTRNYQFIHHLYVENAAGPDIWVLTNKDEGPGAVDHLTAALVYHRASFTLQLEGFIKWQQNLRRHETALRPRTIPDGAVLFAPWTHDNQARAEGLEALLTRRFGLASLTATYTLSRTQIRHPDANAGAYSLADWDRPHQFAIHAQLPVTRSVSATFSWNVASGQPNALLYLDDSAKSRYPTYRRLDFVLRYRRPLYPIGIEGFIRIYNLLDTKNTWYRTLETVLLGRGQNIRLAFEPIDVYDLRFQPSFGLTISF